MVLINLGIIILFIGLIVSLAYRFLWLFSIIFLYRFTSYFITYSLLKEIFQIKSYFVYFLIILTISIAIHYGVIRLTHELTWVRYLFFSVIIVWVLLVYDFLEIFLLKDWLIANGLWGWSNIQDQLKVLFSTSPEEFKGYLMDAMNKFIEIFNNIFGFLGNRK